MICNAIMLVIFTIILFVFRLHPDYIFLSLVAWWSFIYALLMLLPTIQEALIYHRSNCMKKMETIWYILRSPGSLCMLLSLIYNLGFHIFLYIIEAFY